MIRQILLFINILIFTPIFSIIIILVGFFDTKKIYTSLLAKIWARVILFLSYISCQTENIHLIKSKEKYIIVSNHQSLLDILVSFAYIPLKISFFTKKELFRIPIFGSAMKLAGMVYVDRYNENTSKDCVNITLNTINNNCLSYQIYPESTRTNFKELKKFKKGAFIFAIKSSLSILPVTLIYSDKKLANSKIRLVVGNAINTVNYNIDQRDKLISRTRDIIESQLKKEFN